MSTPSLSRFIRTNLESILDAWEQFAQNLSAEKNMEGGALREHAANILLAIAIDLDKLQTSVEQSEKPMGRAPPSAGEADAESNGTSRVSKDFSVNDTMSEFRALRASVLYLWSVINTVAPDTVDKPARFNEAIDQALTDLLWRCTAGTDRMTRWFDILLSSSPDLNCLTDLEGRLIYANKALTDLYGTHLSGVIGKKFSDLGRHSVPDLGQLIARVVATKTTCRGDLSYMLDSHAQASYEYLLIPVFDGGGRIEAVAGTAREVSERHAMLELATDHATYDKLSSLPNRALFFDLLKRETIRSERTGLPLALLLINLDGFKGVNERFGHEGGDLLLREAARRIQSRVREMDTVARIGGDEFTVILPDVRNTAHVGLLAQQIIDELGRPFTVLDNDIVISGSIGISLFPQDTGLPEDLFRNAGQAMSASKNTGRNRFNFFMQSMREASGTRMKIIGELRHALAQRQFVLTFQPIVDLGTLDIVKAEALLQWQHPTEGLLHPPQFIGLAEEAGLIGAIDEWVMGEAVMRAREWSALRGEPFQISVNRSSAELLSKAPLKRWDAQLTMMRSVWNCISIEFDESVLLHDLPWVRERLETFQLAGAQLSIDDFGTNYSSMSTLRKYHIDFLKIDRSFVRDMAADMESRTFAETIVAMGHRLGLEVIAEGVETAEQRDWLKMVGCDYAQGHLFSPPVSAQDFEHLLMA